MSVVSAYQDGQTYNQVSDLLKGIIKEDQVFIEKHVPGQATEIPDPIVQYEEPVHLQVKVPKIDQNLLHMRQVEFEKRKNEWLAKLSK